MSENGLNIFNLVLTHLNQPWGPPWTLATLSDPWRPLATIGDMLEHGHVGNGQNQHCGKVFLKKSVSMTSFKILQYFYLRLLPIDIIDWEGPCLLLFLYNETEGVKVKTAIFRFWKSNETGGSLGVREGEAWTGREAWDLTNLCEMASICSCNRWK